MSVLVKSTDFFQMINVEIKAMYVYFLLVTQNVIQYILDYLNTRLYKPSIIGTQPWLDCTRAVVTLLIGQNFSEVRRMAEKLE